MKTFKKKMIALCSILAITATTASVALAVNSASAETLSTSENFYMTDIVEIRTVTDENAIRWSTNVTQAYWTSITETYDGATIEFHTVINRAENPVTEDAMDFSYIFENGETPTFTDGVYTYYHAIYFDNLQSELEAKYSDAETVNAYLQKAYSMELSATAYVRIVRDGEEDVIIAAENADNTRSMQGLALDKLSSGNYDSADEEAIKSYVGSENYTCTPSTEIDSFYSAETKTGTIILNNLGTETISADADVYVGAKKVNATIVENKITIEGLTLTEKEDYTLNVYNGNGEAYAQTFKCATKILTTLADFNMFIQSSTDAEGDYNTVLDGYYVLGNDIDVSKETVSANKSFTQVYTLANATEFNVKKEQGLTGTFDGNGHTINGLVLRGAGIFWRVCEGATVKNFALTELNLASDTNTAALACQVRGTLENIYVQTSKAPQNYNALLASQIILSTTAKMNNIIVDGEDFVSTTSNSFGIVQNNQGSCNKKTSKNVSNVYFISTSICGGNNTDGAKVDAGNRSVKTKTDGTAISLNVIYGAKRYDSWKDMKEGATYDSTTDAKVENVTEKNDYSSFTKYWTITDRVPVWTGNPNK